MTVISDVSTMNHELDITVFFVGWELFGISIFESFDFRF